MMKYKDWLIVGLAFMVVGFAGLSLSCSRLNAADKLYRECTSFTMYEDGSYTCAKPDGSSFSSCVKGGRCED